MLVFTDGGCVGNGRLNAKASYAVFINNKIISGHVKPYEYIINVTNNDVYNISLSCNNKYIQPSNNRGELLSLIQAFIEILKTDNDNYIVYSDSQICVKTINEWYDNRLRKGTLHEFKNLDLIEILMYLYKKIKTYKSIKVLHIRGHQKITIDMTEEQKKIINGNNIVDLYASNMLKLNTFIDSKIDYLSI